MPHSGLGIWEICQQHGKAADCEIAESDRSDRYLIPSHFLLLKETFTFRRVILRHGCQPNPHVLLHAHALQLSVSWTQMFKCAVIYMVFMKVPLRPQGVPPNVNLQKFRDSLVNKLIHKFITLENFRDRVYNGLCIWCQRFCVLCFENFTPSLFSPSPLWSLSSIFKT